MPPEFKRTVFESEPAATIEADAITVIQHSQWSSRFAHPGAYMVFGYNIHEGMVVPITADDAPPDYGNCYKFLKPNQAQAVREQTENGLLKAIVLNRGGTTEVIRDTRQNRRELAKEGIVARAFMLPAASHSFLND